MTGILGTLHSPAPPPAKNHEWIVDYEKNSEEAPRASAATRRKRREGGRLRQEFWGRSTCKRRHVLKQPFTESGGHWKQGNWLHYGHSRLISWVKGIKLKLLKCSSSNPCQLCVTPFSLSMPPEHTEYRLRHRCRHKPSTIRRSVACEDVWAVCRAQVSMQQRSQPD